MIQDFKEYFKENEEDFLNRTVNIENLPVDDEWVLDDEWDIDTTRNSSIYKNP